MGRIGDRWDITEGTDVIAADGDKVGKVVSIHQDYIVVEKGFFFPTDYYIPTSAIASYDGDKVYLSVGKDAALNQGWDVEPLTSGAGYGTTAATGYAEGRAERLTEEERLRVPVHEEELTATKRPVERGAVRIEKDVIAEERTLEVPVTEERVRVERRAVDRDVAPDEAAFEEGTIEVPVRGEEVDLQKRTRVREEVDVGKERVQRIEQVGGTVRREEVHIDEDVTGETPR